MPELPSGHVTFVFTDIEGSTRLHQRLGARFHSLLEQPDEILAGAIAHHHGAVVKSMGDGVFATFPEPRDAILACLDAQRALRDRAWPDGAEVRVRMGVHEGKATPRDADYITLDVHRAARIEAAGHGGQVLVSADVTDRVRNRLPPGMSLRDLGRYRLKDFDEPQLLYQLVHPELVGEFPAIRVPPDAASSLPRPRTSLVGRTRELSALRGLVDRNPLVTVIAAGGMGKTRLALEFAAETQSSFPGGVWFVDLAGVEDPSTVPSVVADALGVRSLIDIAQAIAERLASRSLLLLDNCDRVVDACAVLVDAMIARGSGFSVLVTSREALSIPGETQFRLRPFGSEDSDRTGVPWMERDAVRMFVERARLVRPTMGFSEEGLALVARICNRVDRIPLAIELAAARMASLGLQELAERLDRSFDILATGERGRASRHRALQATLDWSHDLLARSEQVLFRRLGCFSGGFDLEAVETVCPDDSLPRAAVLDTMESLVLKSLVEIQDGAEALRYRLLASTRDYAMNRLKASGELKDLRVRHTDHYLAIAEASREAIQGPRQIQTLDRLAPDHDNFRAAFDAAVEDSNYRTVLRLAIALADFWRYRGHLREGTRRLRQALARSGTRDPGLIGRARWELGRLLQWQGDQLGASAELKAAVQSAREAGDEHTEARALQLLGRCVFELGDPAEGKQLTEQALGLAVRIGDVYQLGWALLVLGMMETDTDAGAAAENVAKAEAIFRDIEDPRTLAVAVEFRGITEVARGDIERGLEAYAEALELLTTVGDRSSQAGVWGDIALANIGRGDLGGAHEAAARSIRLAEAVGDQGAIAEGLWIHAFFALEDDPRRAGLFVGAAQNLQERLRLSLRDMRRTVDPEALVARLSAALGDELEPTIARGRHADVRKLARSIAESSER